MSRERVASLFFLTDEHLDKRSTNLDPNSRAIARAEIQHARLRQASRSAAEHCERQLDADREMRTRDMDNLLSEHTDGMV